MADLAARWPLRDEEVVVGGRRWRLWRPVDPDGLLDERAFARDEANLPYWAELWPAARALAAWLAEDPLAVPRALELGCGLGLPSLVWTARTGGWAVATDRVAPALALLRHHAAAHGVATLRPVLRDWREPLRRWRRLGRFPALWGSDLWYERPAARRLAAVLAVVAAPGAIARFADPGRGGYEAFTAALAARGWRRTVVERRVVEGYRGAIRLEEWRAPGPPPRGTLPRTQKPEP